MFTVVDGIAESMASVMTYFAILGVGFLVYLLVRAGWQLVWSLVPRLAKKHWLRQAFLLTYSVAVLGQDRMIDAPGFISEMGADVFPE